MDNNTLLLLGLVLCCVLPFGVILLLSLWVLQYAQRWIAAEPTAMRAGFEKLKAQNPTLNTDHLTNRIINRQALRAGIVGAVTSVGGLPFLPIGLPLDLLATARIQTELLHFLAWAHRGEGAATPHILNLNQALSLRMETAGQLLLLEGGQRLSSYLVRRMALLVAEKSFAKIIPGLGLVIGFAVNYLTTQGMARVAARWYAGKVPGVRSVQTP
jgi:hypothetical protein